MEQREIVHYWLNVYYGKIKDVNEKSSMYLHMTQ
jgi:hypothetical protein